MNRINSFYLKLHLESVALSASKIAQNLILSKFNLSRKLFDFEEYESDDSSKSVIYISSSEEESSDWETDCSTDTEQLIARIEREVTSSPVLIGGRMMTMDKPEDEARAGPSTPYVEERTTPKLGIKYFTGKCVMPRQGKSKRNA